jgi:hypothetical protein
MRTKSRVGAPSNEGGSLQIIRPPADSCSEPLAHTFSVLRRKHRPTEANKAPASRASYEPSPFARKSRTPSVAPCFGHNLVTALGAAQIVMIVLQTVGQRILGASGARLQRAKRIAAALLAPKTLNYRRPFAFSTGPRRRRAAGSAVSRARTRGTTKAGLSGRVVRASER